MLPVNGMRRGRTYVSQVQGRKTRVERKEERMHMRSTGDQQHKANQTSMTVPNTGGITRRPTQTD